MVRSERMGRRRRSLRVSPARQRALATRLPNGVSIPRGLRRVGGHAYLDGWRIYSDDLLELYRDEGNCVRGRYWRSQGAQWDCLICSDRWIAYIIGPSSALRWPSAERPHAISVD